MFCPECGGEFRAGILECPDCEVALVGEVDEPQHDHSDFVSVFSADDPAILPVAKSLLDETDIPYTVKGEETMALFPTTGTGLLIDSDAEAAEILVPADRAEEAEELLAELPEPEDPDLDPQLLGEEE
ncbi:MAG: DUF2007 domain-containing protein [Thermoanaerobaculia bacterium]|nr:DUF2007 domain-containing protein [Thermoanaerobaculia bacterium]